MAFLVSRPFFFEIPDYITDGCCVLPYSFQFERFPCSQLAAPSEEGRGEREEGGKRKERKREGEKREEKGRGGEYKGSFGKAIVPLRP